MRSHTFCGGSIFIPAKAQMMITSYNSATTRFPEQLPIPQEVQQEAGTTQETFPVTMTPTTSTSDKTSTNVEELNAVELLNFLKGKGVQFFRNQFDETYAWLPSDGEEHGVSRPLSSRKCLACLYKIVTPFDGSFAILALLRRAVELATLEALNGPKVSLSVRTAWDDDQLLIDLCDDTGTAISVSANGWNVVRVQTPKFVQFKHMQELPAPVEGGEVSAIFDFFPDMDDGTQLLILAWLVSSLCPQIISPILTFLGPPGSAKTTRSRIIRDLVDPSEIPVLGEMTRADLQLVFQTHAVPCFENVGNFDPKRADQYCRAVTGNGIQKRKLFTDSDEVLYRFQRSIIMNGISVPSTRSDFLDRCLLIECKKLTEFASEHSIYARFKAERPRLLGGLLDLLVKGLEQLASVTPSPEFRLHDFAVIGRAVAVALGRSATDFDDAYRDKLQLGISIIRDDHPMLALLNSFSKKYTEEQPWSGNASELLARLHALRRSSGSTLARKDLPGNGRWLRNRLDELDGLLFQEGIRIHRRRESGSRKIIVYNSEPSQRIAELTRELEGGGDNA
jgi:hypothetical protein